MKTKRRYYLNAYPYMIIHSQMGSGYSLFSKRERDIAFFLNGNGIFAKNKYDKRNGIFHIRDRNRAFFSKRDRDRDPPSGPSEKEEGVVILNFST